MFILCTVNDLQFPTVPTVPLLCISPLFSSYTFRMYCHHQGAEAMLPALTAIK